jgi:cysteine desulfuration protein SufE
MSSPEFDAKLSTCPPGLQEVIEEFRMVEPRERLEYLVEYAMELPDLPERLASKMDEMEQVHECQSPVFLHTELEDGAVQFYLGIPREAPTVRGYAGALLEGLEDATPDQVLAMPDDIYMLMGLHEAITPQRLRGLHALVGYMKRQVKSIEATKSGEA